MMPDSTHSDTLPIGTLLSANDNDYNHMSAVHSHQAHAPNNTPNQKQTLNIPFNGKTIRKYFNIQYNQSAIRLSARQIQCLSCITQGLTAKEAANALHISHRTVETHLYNLNQKLVCKNRCQMANAWNIIKAQIQD